METIRQVLEGEPRRPSSVNPAIDRDLGTICLRCLEKDPQRRYAQSLLEQSKTAAVEQRFAAQEKVRDIHEQADARLNQALRDAGRIVADAEKRAEQIAGDAYSALRDKQLLEQAAEAMRNVIEGYGDRYLVPTHSLLDDLAAEYGYDAAGQALASAREQSKRMVEQGEAATCDYAEANRRKTAIQFVIHAFNGHVDSFTSAGANAAPFLIALTVDDASLKESQKQPGQAGARSGS